MNRKGLTVVREFDPAPITTLLCDADDNLFPSERPAFAASTEVTNRFLTRFGVTAPLSAEELRKRAIGKNFRTTAVDLAVQCEVPIEQTLAQGRPEARVASDSDVANGHALCADELEQWVLQEREQVTAHLAATLKPDPQVLEPLRDLATHYTLAAVSSSAIKRLQCLLHRHRARPADTAGRALQRGGFTSRADKQTRPRGVSACRPGTGRRRSSRAGDRRLRGRRHLCGRGRLRHRR